MHRHILSSHHGVTSKLRRWTRYLKHEAHQTVVLTPSALPIAYRTTKRARHFTTCVVTVTQSPDPALQTLRKPNRDRRFGSKIRSFRHSRSECSDTAVGNVR